MIENFIDNNVMADYDEKVYDLLRYASACGSFECLEVIYTNFKFDINNKDRKGISVLILACKNGNMDVASYLLKE